MDSDSDSTVVTKVKIKYKELLNSINVKFIEKFNLIQTSTNLNDRITK